MREEYLTANPTQTRKLGERLAKKILRTGFQRKAVVLALRGDLGGGKTTFLQGFAKGLKMKQKILSPTFVIMKRFTIYHLPFTSFYHIDCYRIRKPKEVLDLGFREIISNPKNIVALEWAEKIKKILPQNSIFIKFKFRDKKTRKIVFPKSNF